MKKLISALIFIVGLTACSKPVETVETPENYQVIQILSIKKPKNFVLKYKIMSTGEVVTTKQRYCNQWRSVRVNSFYNANLNLSGCDVIKSIK